MASEWISIKEAGERFGVSADTIRRRLKRGEIVGRKESTAQGFTWVIEVPANLEAAQPEQATSAHGGSDAFELVQLRERVAGLERLTTELAEDRNAWREQAARSEESARELRILVQQAQALAQALPAGESFHHDEDKASSVPPGSEQENKSTAGILRRQWRFWKH